jgi:tRNA 2-thiouridine synthesizing protein A
MKELADSPPSLPRADRTLDLKGLNCPLPILKSKKALGEMQTGQTLLVLATDGGAWDDFDYFCANTGHRLIERREDNGIYWFFIARK